MKGSGDHRQLELRTAVALAEQTLAAAVEGDFRHFDEVLHQLCSGRSDQQQAWALALHAARWHAALPGSWQPDRPAVLAFVGTAPDARRGAAMACAYQEKAAVLAFDRQALADWIELHRQLVAPDDPPGSRLWLQAAELWLRYLNGGSVGLDAAAAELEARSAHHRSAALVIECAALRALALLALGELSQANEVARRASRMARTEALPQWEYLANLVLARVRRLTSRPFMATRILSALSGIATPPWHGWIAWELQLAGGRAASQQLIAGLSARVSQQSADDRPCWATAAALDLDRLLTAVGQGRRDEYERIAEQLGSWVAGFPELARELQELLVVVDPHADVTRASPALQKWLVGQVDAMPAGLSGLSTPEADDESSSPAAEAWVVADPRGIVRRVVTRGLPLLSRSTRAVVLPQSRRRSGREDTTLAALALGGRDGVAVELLFEQIYDFAFEPELHDSVFRVLLARVNARLGDAGQVSLTAGRVRLRHERTLVMADPRCSLGVDGRVLLLLARKGRTTARATAQELGVPLRTVQAALKALSDDGACRTEKQGRSVQYVIEDTTFCEPTRL